MSCQQNRREGELFRKKNKRNFCPQIGPGRQSESFIVYVIYKETPASVRVYLFSGPQKVETGERIMEKESERWWTPIHPGLFFSFLFFSSPNTPPQSWEKWSVRPGPRSRNSSSLWRNRFKTWMYPAFCMTEFFHSSSCWPPSSVGGRSKTANKCSASLLDSWDFNLMQGPVWGGEEKKELSAQTLREREGWMSGWGGI